MNKDVIIACDFNGKEQLFAFLDKFKEEKPYLKVGMELFYASGNQIIKEIKFYKDEFFCKISKKNFKKIAKTKSKIIERNEAKNAICKQTYENFEIILVENNSKDSSYELCLSLEKEDSRIRALQIKEKGTSLARKKGVENAKGKYIIFSDQDLPE